MWALYLVLGILAGIVVAGLMTVLLRILFGSRNRQQIIVTEVAAVAAIQSPLLTSASEFEPITEVKLFLLSRQDVIDYVDAMRNNPERFPLIPNLKERETEKFPDYIRCGEICFSVVFELHDCVHNIAVRLNKETATALGGAHPVERAEYLSGDDWYNLAVDQSYKCKREVFGILNASYDYVFGMFSPRSEEETKAESVHIEEEYANYAVEIEKAALIAESKYLAALEKFKSEHYTEFYITRREMVADTLALNNTDIKVLERVEPQMPVSLKYKDKTYAILYGTDRGVMMVVKLSDVFADKLAVKHPEIRRAKFPAGANWYYVPVDGAFDSKEAVYTVLNASYGYVLVKYGTEEQIKAAPKLIYTDFSVNKDEKEINNTGGYTRASIIQYIRNLNNPDITIIDRPMEPQLPVSLKLQGKTYGMLYGTENGVIMIIKLSDAYAEELRKKHRNITKAKFPAGSNWFSVPITNIFTEEQVYATLNNSIEFLTEYKVKKQKEAELKPKERLKPIN